MEGEFDWRSIENSCPENRELGEVLRWLGRFHCGDPSLDWPQARQRHAEALEGYLESSPQSRSLILRLEDAEYEIGGDEHLILRLEEEPDRVYKVTHGDAFGCYSFFSPCDPDLTGKHFHGSINEDPALYLRRWMLLNSFSEYVTRFEGLLPPEEHLKLPRICVSQPALDTPNPTLNEIRESLAPFGFQQISRDAYLNFENRILLTDAAPRNVRIVDGSLALFDVIASQASEKIHAWAASQK